jgi:DHA1 family tetracycline resistance protein-like MFS transporter
MALVQGRCIGPLARRFGEPRLLVWGTGLLVLGYAAAPLVRSGLGVAVLILPIAVGTGVTNPSLASLASQVADPTEQGQVLGVSQSLSSLGRVVGPTWGGWVFDVGGQGAPYVLSAAWMVVALGLALRLSRRLRERAPVAPSPHDRSRAERVEA